MITRLRAGHSQDQLRSGGLRDLHAVYAGLRSGRLVIVGSPGAGKSGAAVLLVLAALRHRNAVTDTDRWVRRRLRDTWDGLVGPPVRDHRARTTPGDGVARDVRQDAYTAT